MSDKWKCDVCGYIHDGNEPPEKCPICGVGSNQFSVFSCVVIENKATVNQWRCTICGYIHEDTEP